MPYSWTPPGNSPTEELHLWPHQSLPPRGFVWFVSVTIALIMLPLAMLVGSVALWGLLPFLLLTIWGIWAALKRSWRDRQITEVLTLSEDRARLVRTNPRGPAQSWESNRYWVSANIHRTGGPVPNYVTLRGNGREVEIGAFLSEDERLSLYDELQRVLSVQGRSPEPVEHS